jgi:hypothetical protein
MSKTTMMIAVPYAEFRYNYSFSKKAMEPWYQTPSGESWSFSPLECRVDENTTAEDIFQAFEEKITQCELDDGLDLDCRWSWIQQYRDRVAGFALVKPEIAALLEGTRALAGSDGAGDAIANFRVAFCVKNAERLLKVKHECS